MKYRKEFFICCVITGLLLFLRSINILREENGFGTLPGIIILAVTGSACTIRIQKAADEQQKNGIEAYDLLDAIRYVSAVLIMILHMRPFAAISDAADLAFNNIVTRICVPFFFVITGFFAARKEKDQPDYIRSYVKKTIPVYLIWSVLYVPVLLHAASQVIPEFYTDLSLPSMPGILWFLTALIGSLLAVIAALTYTGVWYHLWYFPALLMSLLVLERWKKKFSVESLLICSGILLLFGATETYYGMIPSGIRQLLSVYYSMFFTTRNFLFFGLFYVVLGYYLGRKERLYSPYCVMKFILSAVLLTAEAILLHDTERLDSNILLSCVPLVYYLFVTVIHLPLKIPCHDRLRTFSKYYYLIHPMVLSFMAVYIPLYDHPVLRIAVMVLLTHAASYAVLLLKKLFKSYSVRSAQQFWQKPHAGRICSPADRQL